MFSQKKKKIILSWENGTLIFREMKLFGRKIKKISGGKFPSLQNKNKTSEKLSYISKNGIFYSQIT